MDDKKMTEGERNAYNRGATRWGIGVGLATTLVGIIGVFATYEWTRQIDWQGSMKISSVFPSAQASEPDHKDKDLFALNSPANACQYDSDFIAWQRDDRFATQLRVWCVEKSDGAEGDTIVVWSQAENQRFASRREINTMFYSHKVLLDDESKKPYIDACGEDGFLGWSVSGSSYGVNLIRRNGRDKTQITGFLGGNLWCIGDDLYMLQDALERNDNRPDHRIDVAKGVETDWTP